MLAGSGSRRSGIARTANLLTSGFEPPGGGDRAQVPDGVSRGAHHFFPVFVSMIAASIGAVDVIQAMTRAFHFDMRITPSALKVP